MGFAKLLGRDYGTPYTEQMGALDIFIYWSVGAMPLLFFGSILVFSEPNFVVPILIYFIGALFLFIRYIRVEMRGKDD